MGSAIMSLCCREKADWVKNKGDNQLIVTFTSFGCEGLRLHSHEANSVLLHSSPSLRKLQHNILDFTPGNIISL
jgi:hypothetical protein